MPEYGVGGKRNKGEHHRDDKNREQVSQNIKGELYRPALWQFIKQKLNPAGKNHQRRNTTHPKKYGSRRHIDARPVHKHSIARLTKRIGNRQDQKRQCAHQPTLGQNGKAVANMVIPILRLTSRAFFPCVITQPVQQHQ